MNLKENGYPEFWGVVKKDFNKKLINPNLKCPMNYLCKVELKKIRATTSTLLMSHFFVREKATDKTKAKKVETLIQKYSIDLYNSPIKEKNDTGEEYLLLKDDFNEMIKEIQSLYLSNNCLDLMSWLLDRAFCISPYVKAKEKEIKTVINTNKSLLLSVLYSVSKGNLLKCFSKGVIK